MVRIVMLSVNYHQKQAIFFFGARLKKPAYGINDAPRRWWNILDEALCGFGMVPTRADRCCYVLYSTQTCMSESEQRALHRSMALMTSHLNRAHDQKEMQHLRECWIQQKGDQLQENP